MIRSQALDILATLFVFGCSIIFYQFLFGRGGGVEGGVSGQGSLNIALNSSVVSKGNMDLAVILMTYNLKKQQQQQHQQQQQQQQQPTTAITNNNIINCLD